MANIVLPHTWVPLEVPTAANFNAVQNEIRDKFNTYAVQTDVAKTITVAHTFGADILFTDALYDIGKSGATRPRDIFLSRTLVAGGTIRANLGGSDTIGSRRAITISHGGSEWWSLGMDLAGGYFRMDFLDPNNAGASKYATLSAAPTGTGACIIIGAAGPPSGIAAGDLAVAQDKTFFIGGARITNADAGERFLFRGTTAGNSALRMVGLDGAGVLSLDAVANNNSATSRDLQFQPNGGKVLIGTSLATGAAAGDVVIGNNRWLRGANATVASAKALIGISGADVVFIAPDGNLIALGAPGTTAGAGGGDPVLGNSHPLRGGNAANTNTLSLIHLDGSDRVYLSGSAADIVWGKPNVALGGGAAPTFGTIGGSGPAVAAQNEWMRVINSAGQTRYIPVWA